MLVFDCFLAEIQRMWFEESWHKITPFLGPAYDTGVGGSPKLLAEAKSSENERRHEARLRNLTRPGPKARRI